VDTGYMTLCWTVGLTWSRGLAVLRRRPHLLYIKKLREAMENSLKVITTRSYRNLWQVTG
jgi:hypothetical protein